MNEEQVRRQWRRHAERILDDPPDHGAHGRLRVALQEMAADAQRDLAQAERDLQAAVDARRTARRRLHAIGFTIRGGRDQRHRQAPAARRVAPEATPPDRYDETATLPPELLGPALVAILQELRRPLSVEELVRLLAADGHHPIGRASKSVSDALRAPLRQGLVRRVGRGWYQAVAVRSA